MPGSFAPTSVRWGPDNRTCALRLVGHGHSLRVLTARWLGLEVATGAHFKLAAAAVSVLGHERVTPTIDRWSV